MDVDVSDGIHDVANRRECDNDTINTRARTERPDICGDNPRPILRVRRHLQLRAQADELLGQVHDVCEVRGAIQCQQRGVGGGGRGAESVCSAGCAGADNGGANIESLSKQRVCGAVLLECVLGTLRGHVSGVDELVVAGDVVEPVHTDTGTDVLVRCDRDSVDGIFGTDVSDGVRDARGCGGSDSWWCISEHIRWPAVAS